MNTINQTNKWIIRFSVATPSGKELTVAKVIDSHMVESSISTPAGDLVRIDSHNLVDTLIDQIHKENDK